MRFGVFSDFDGTITLRDCNDALVDTYIGPDRREAYDRLFLTGNGTLWEVLDTSMRACEVPLEHAIEMLLDKVAIDPTFVDFHGWCSQRAVPFSIVSAGLVEIIEAFMSRAGLELPITANQAFRHPQRFGLIPKDSDCPTGVDKAAVLREAKATGLFTVFVGDGFSDRQAAPEADLVFAKRNMALAQYCEAHAIAYTPFDRFSEVQAFLEQKMMMAQ